jgi:hypothetical protein
LATIKTEGSDSYHGLQPWLGYSSGIFSAAVAPHFLHYNLARIHKTLRITPAMAAGVSDHVWRYAEIASLSMSVDRYEREYHLTPAGWQVGTYSYYGKAERAVPAPSNRVPTIVKEVEQTSGWSPEDGADRYRTLGVKFPESHRQLRRAKDQTDAVFFRKMK